MELKKSRELTVQSKEDVLERIQNGEFVIINYSDKALRKRSLKE